MFRRSFPLYALLVFLVSTGASAQWLYGKPKAVARLKAPDSLLVKFKPGRSVEGFKMVRGLAARGALAPLVQRKEIPGVGIFAYRVFDPAALQRTLAAIKKMPQVQYVEPAQRVRLLSDPNDTYFSMTTDGTQWVLFPPDSWPFQWPLQFVNASAAWDIYPGTFYTSATKPRNAIKVAVIDTGVDISHPDFVNDGGASVDARFGGQLDLEDGVNLINGGVGVDPNPLDEYGHGTHVSGIVGAATNNAQGIASLAYNSQVMPLKVIDASGDGDDVDVIDAMVYAADHGAQVINMSLAVNGGYSQGLQDAVNYCWAKNCLVVAAAGNDGVDYVRRYPAACDKVLAVAATTYADANTIPPVESFASYSNQGLYLGIAAPGGDASYWNGGDLGFVPELNTLVWSTTPTGSSVLTDSGITSTTYGWLNGTSMASPHAAALAALYAGYKGFTPNTAGAPQMMVQAIQRGAVNLSGRADGGWNPAYGYGRIDALATLQERLGDGRETTDKGGITGQITYFQTPVINASITAVGARTYNASSKEDGTFRLINVPAGDYIVTCKYIGIVRTAPIHVTAGCDTMGTSFEMSANQTTVTVSPHVTSVAYGGTFKFTAVVFGSPNLNVTWSVASGPGTIDANGVYHAPNSGAQDAQVTIKATSVADPTASDTALVVLKNDYSIFTSQIPYYQNVTDGVPYELGVKFYSNVSGSITGIRYWKAASDGGTHNGNLWNESNGSLLGSVTFTNETASGWQVARFAAPIHITGGQVCVSSVNTNGFFNVTPFALGYHGMVTNGILATEINTFNGVASYVKGTFPTNSYNDSNYFVDVLFVPDP